RPAARDRRLPRDDRPGTGAYGLAPLDGRGLACARRYARRALAWRLDRRGGDGQRLRALQRPLALVLPSSAAPGAGWVLARAAVTRGVGGHGAGLAGGVVAALLSAVGPLGYAAQRRTRLKPAAPA